MFEAITFREYTVIEYGFALIYVCKIRYLYYLTIIRKYRPYILAIILSK